MLSGTFSDDNTEFLQRYNGNSTLQRSVTLSSLKSLRLFLHHFSFTDGKTNFTDRPWGHRNFFSSFSFELKFQLLFYFTFIQELKTKVNFCYRKLFIHYFLRQLVFCICPESQLFKTNKSCYNTQVILKRILVFTTKRYRNTVMGFVSLGDFLGRGNLLRSDLKINVHLLIQENINNSHYI